MSNPPDGSPEWHERRLAGLGGSEVAKVFGISPFGSSRQLWRLKTGREKPFAGNRYTRRGTELEPYVCSRFAREYGIKVEPGPSFVRHEEWDKGVVLQANVDRLLNRGTGLFEAKTTGESTDTACYFLEGEIPPYYALQVLHYAACVDGVVTVVVACLIGDGDPDTCELAAVEFELDEATTAAISLIEEVCAEWWATHVVGDVEPPKGKHPRAGELLELLERLPVRKLERATETKKTEATRPASPVKPAPPRATEKAMQFGFSPAKRAKMYARIGLVGVSGAGKTFTALTIAAGLGERIAVIDTEHDRSTLYAGTVAEFAHCPLPDHAPATYQRAMDMAAQAGFDVLVIDSLSHAWAGRDGLLEQKDKASKKTRNDFAAWRDITPKHNQLIDAMLSWPGHLIVTMRAKTEYIIEDNGRGKKVPRKIGMAPVQRDGMEYEFDLVADLDLEHNFLISKSRYVDLGLDGAVIHKPGRELGESIRDWLNGGAGAKPGPRLVATHAATPPELDDPLVATAALETRRKEIAELWGLDPADGGKLYEVIHAAVRKAAKVDDKTPWAKIPTGPIRSIYKKLAICANDAKPDAAAEQLVKISQWVQIDWSNEELGKLAA